MTDEQRQACIDGAKAMGWPVYSAMFPAAEAPFTYPCVEDQGGVFWRYRDDTFMPSHWWPYKSLNQAWDCARALGCIHSALAALNAQPEPPTSEQAAMIVMGVVGGSLRGKW